MDVRVRLLPSGETLRATRGTSLMAIVRSRGLPLASACGANGLCGRCGVRVIRGVVSGETALEARIKARNRIDPALRLACQTCATGDVEITTSYW